MPILKLTFALLFLVMPSLAGEAAKEPAFRRGTEVRLAALDGAAWLQGGPPKAFEPGKVYLFLCWAAADQAGTVALERAQALHEKFSGKGLSVFGLHVGSDTRESVELWLKARGGRLSYPVAWSGGLSGVETQWIKEARVEALPHAFLVRNGRLALSVQPVGIADPVIESLLDGGDGGERMTRVLPEAEVERKMEVPVLMREFRQASARGDAEGMEKQIEALAKADAAHTYLPSMRLELLTVRQQWNEAAQYLQGIPAGPERRIALVMAANRVAHAPEGKFPAAWVATLAEASAERMAADGQRVSPYEWASLASLFWRAGNPEKAAASARTAVEAAAKADAARGMPAAAFERFARRIDEGNPASLSELSRWIAEILSENPSRTGLEKIR